MMEGLLGAELQREHQPPQPRDVAQSRANATRLRWLFSDVEPIPFERGLQSPLDWLRAP